MLADKANAGNTKQPDLFTGIIPPDHALVRAPPRPSRPRATNKTIVDVEGVAVCTTTVSIEKSGDAVVDVPANAKAENPIVIVPPASAPAERTLPTPQQHVEALCQKLTVLAETHDVRHTVVWDERGAGRSDLRIKRKRFQLTRTLTWVAVICGGLGAGAYLTRDMWLPPIKPKVAPPVVMPTPPKKPEVFGPPAPPKAKRRRSTTTTPKTPPTWLERQLGWDK